MYKMVLVMFLVLGLALSSFGCGRFTGGAAVGGAVGAVGTGAAYELKARQQMERLEKDYREGKITQEEYEIRKDQISKGSIFY